MGSEVGEVALEAKMLPIRRLIAGGGLIDEGMDFLERCRRGLLTWRS